MESGSITLISKAVLFSLILHAFVLYLIAVFMVRSERPEEYPEISVFLSTSDRSDLTPGRDPEKKTDKMTSESENIDPDPPAPVSPVIDSIPVSENQPVNPQITEPLIVPAKTEEPVVSEHIPESFYPDTPAEEFKGVDEIRNEPGSEGSEEKVSSDLASDDSGSGSSGSESSLDVVWTGSSARFRHIPDPQFRLPYGVTLSDEVHVSFTVLSDGTVSSVRVLPPGSGSLDLDGQIRIYVNSFIFDSFRASEENKTGLLRLNLLARTTGGS